MEEQYQPTFLEGEIVGISFALATHKEICTASVIDCPISHSSQLTNPFLGLPLEFGKCESCGISEPGKCEGHFGYIELPTPIYHPNHVSELKRMLSLLCLKCLKLTRREVKNMNVAKRIFSCCEEASKVSIKEVKTSGGACFLQLKLHSRLKPRWSFLKRYGFEYGNGFTRTLLPSEVLEMLKRIPEGTRKKLVGKGYFPQNGYVMQCLPVPPNCLSVLEVSDGISVISSDLSISMLKKVIKQVEMIKSSRSGSPNFKSQEVEVNCLQSAVHQYLQLRGTARLPRDFGKGFGTKECSSESTTKAWLEKMRTLFIRKGCGFSSRSVITGDAYKPVTEIGVPSEIAQRITSEERVCTHNMRRLQGLMDGKLCLTFRDGSSTYSLREGSKGHMFLLPGQIVHRRVMDGDVVFINRPPTTHKHSLQALSVYTHGDHTVKINPLICGPLSADFDGDCIHLFYPQSLSARAEVLELFLVKKQLPSSHSGSLNLQLTSDSLLSLKAMFGFYFLAKAAAQQLAMFASRPLPDPALLEVQNACPLWTAPQVLQTALPPSLDCCGGSYLIRDGDLLAFDFERGAVQSVVNEIATSIFFEKSAEHVIAFFNALQPLLMEYVFSVGFSLCLRDFSLPHSSMQKIKENFTLISPLLRNLRAAHNELAELQVENHVRDARLPVANFILNSSALSDVVDSGIDSAIPKVTQQVGFLGLQISDRGKFYSRALCDDVGSLFEKKYPLDLCNPSARFGLVRGCFFHGLDPYEEMVHSISTREVIVRSSRGLSEPGTLFKNLMAILRDVVVCYDGTVRNVCSGSIIQFEYGFNAGAVSQSLFPPGEPVGVLAATAMSNPAYMAVFDSSPSSNSSWELMKEVLLCKVGFKNDISDRRVLLHLKLCGCGGKYCQEKAAYLVKNQFKKVNLYEIAKCFMIDYNMPQAVAGRLDIDGVSVGHIHLERTRLEELHVTMQMVLQKCQETVILFQKKKSAHIFMKVELLVCESCTLEHHGSEEVQNAPCLMVVFHEINNIPLDVTVRVLADAVFPILGDTIIKGDHRISSVNIIWIIPNTANWIRSSSSNTKGELAVEVVLEKAAVKKSGDAWRIVMDSCIPVFHVIDTNRSIPCAIKQVEQLLGISCAFDQAVQRLSDSVTRVAKGLLKEHLILLSSSVSCTGTLVGFNSGGYKAFSRSLDIQVPFMEATLYTPKKCFLRAAEKCHVDTIASIVASCSWGKHVAVGTGSRFDILYYTKDTCLSLDGSIDVYNFLSMVMSGGGEEPATACLGAEVDDLMPGDDCRDHDWLPSPDRDPNSDKPIFDDADELHSCFTNTTPTAATTWDKVASLSNISSSGNWAEFGSDTKVQHDTESGFSMPSSSASWGTRASRLDEVEPKEEKLACIKMQEDSAMSGGWISSNSRKKEMKEEEEEEEEEETCRDRKATLSSWGGRGDEAEEEETFTNEKNTSNFGASARSLSRKNDLTRNDSSHEWGSTNEGGGGLQGCVTLSDGIGKGKREPQQWGSAGGDLKGRNESHGKSAGVVNNDYHKYTATKQPLEIFTSQEQDILSEVEPLMQYIRRIMHISGYNDGDPLSLEDQSFVLEKVFNYHSDKAAKIASGIDHVIVSKHTTFQDTRCFYVVSPDGSRRDFSYRKCLDGFIKDKYPELADEFINKYFAKTHAHKQNSTPDINTDGNMT